MVTTSLIQTLLRGEGHFNHRSLIIKDGQILYGKIARLFSNQIAEVMVGNEKIIAKLETPLKSGERYWFQVRTGEEKIHLKVLMRDEGTRQGKNDPLHGILKQFHLSPSKENVELLRFFIKEQLPISKETLQNASDLLKGTSDYKEGMEALKQVFLKDLPATKDVFRAVQTAIKNESIVPLLIQLQSLLKTEHLPATGRKLLSMLDALLSSTNQKMNGTHEGRDSIRQESLQSGPELKREEATLIKTTIKSAEGQLINFNSSKEVHEYLKSLVKIMGFSYEKDMIHLLKESNPEELTKLETLKSLLLRFLHESPSAPFKEAAELLLNKITGIQLLSQESAPTQQYVMQLPLPLLNKTTDLTIQWNGRKRENGKIDPAYCRVLFYLNMEFLKEIIVDIKIQNRIMKITVFNEKESIESFAAPFINDLKTNLEKLGYKVSAVHFQNSKTEKVNEKDKSLPLLNYTEKFDGVDIRI